MKTVVDLNNLAGKILTEADVCDIFGYSRDLLLRKIKNNIIPARRPAGSRSYYFLGDDLIKWLSGEPVFSTSHKPRHKKRRYYKGSLGALEALAHSRGLEFTPLNQPFENSHGHHIDKKYVIFIPRDLHRSIYHSQKKPETMKRINDLAYKWLAEQWKLRLRNA